MEVRADGILYAVMWAAYLPVFFYYLRWYYVSRHRKLIAVRVPLIVIPVQLSLLMLMTFTVANFFWETSCGVVILVVGVFISLIYGAGAVTTWALWFLHQITRDSMYRHSQMLEELKEQLRDSKTRNDGANEDAPTSVTISIIHKQAPVLDYSWFLQRKHWVSTGFLTRLFVADSIVMPVIFVAHTASNPEVFSAPLDNCPNIEVPVIVGIVLVGIHSLMIVGHALAIRKYADGFYLKRDLKTWNVAFCFTLLPMILTAVLLADFESETFSFSQFFLMMFVYVMFYIQIVRILRLTEDPLWKSKSLSITFPNLSDVSQAPPSSGNSKQDIEKSYDEAGNVVTLELLDEQTKKNGLPDLKTALVFPEFHEAFKEFLKTEFCVENMLFHEQVQSFQSLLGQCRGKDTLSVVDASFLRLYDQFIAPNSPLEINISARERKTVTQFADSVRVRREKLESIPGEDVREAITQAAFDLDSYLTELEDLIDRTHHIIVRLMHVGPFPRFLTSEGYKDARTRINIRVSERELQLKAPKGNKLSPFSMSSMTEPSRSRSRSYLSRKKSKKSANNSSSQTHSEQTIPLRPSASSTAQGLTTV